MKQSLLILTLLVFLSYGFAQNSQIPPSKYVCPPCDLPCDKEEHDKPGKCSYCNMTLIKKDDVKTVAFYLQDRVEVLDFAGPMEVLAYAGFNVFTVSATKDPIKSQGILKVLPDYTIENAPKADILAFFGGNASSAAKNEKVIEWVQNQENVEYYFSVCTGAFILAEAGILDGKTATTFHNSLDNLQEQYPKIDVKKNVRFVDNGQVVTTAGISAGIDGALHLVAKLRGLNEAKRIAFTMEYDNWRLGNGLILTEDNPYHKVKPVPVLTAYEGTYEYKDGSEIELKLNTKDGGLYAIIKEIPYPIYHENKDEFSDIGNDPIYFKRNESGSVIGYSLSKAGDMFRKL
ncbi:MAG: DJ-1/PfpI family protein [Bacteroidota bacterium]